MCKRKREEKRREEIQRQMCDVCSSSSSFYISTISWCVGSVFARSAASCVIEGPKLKGGGLTSAARERGENSCLLLLVIDLEIERQKWSITFNLFVV